MIIYVNTILVSKRDFGTDGIYAITLWTCYLVGLHNPLFNLSLRLLLYCMSASSEALEWLCRCTGCIRPHHSPVRYDSYRQVILIVIISKSRMLKEWPSSLWVIFWLQNDAIYIFIITTMIVIVICISKVFKILQNRWKCLALACWLLTLLT